MHAVIRRPVTQYQQAQTVKTRRRCGCNGMHEAPSDLSAHRGIGMATDQLESKLTRVGRGMAGWAVGVRGKGGRGGRCPRDGVWWGRGGVVGGCRGASHGQGRVRGLGVGGRGYYDGPPATGIRSSVGTGSPATTGCLFRRARNGTVARTCLVIPWNRQGRGQVAHGVLQESSYGHNPRTCRKLRNRRRAKAEGQA